MSKPAPETPNERRQRFKAMRQRSVAHGFFSNHKPSDSAPALGGTAPAEAADLPRTPFRRKKHTLATLQMDLLDWAGYKFPDQKITGKLAHLKKELQELEDAIQLGLLPEARMEAADVQNLLIQIVGMLSVSAEAHIENCYTKLEICKQRQWGPPGPDGVIEHVRSEATCS